MTTGIEKSKNFECFVRSRISIGRNSTGKNLTMMPTPSATNEDISFLRSQKNKNSATNGNAKPSTCASTMNWRMGSGQRAYNATRAGGLRSSIRIKQRRNIVAHSARNEKILIPYGVSPKIVYDAAKIHSAIGG